MVKHTIFIKVLLSFCWLLIIPGTSASYFSVPEPKGQIAGVVQNRIGKNLKWDNLILTDNLAPNGINDQSNNNQGLLLPESFAVVPADTIDLSFPVYNILTSPLTPGDTAINALYANLKLFKLLEDYDNIRKKTQKIIAEINANLNSNPNSYGLHRLILPAPKSRIELDNPVQAQDIKVKSENGLLSTEARFNKIIQQLVQLEEAEKAAPRKELLQAGAAGLSAGQSGPGTTRSMPTLINTYYNDLYRSSTTIKNNDLNKPSTSQQNQKTYKEEIPLPWIIRFPLHLFGYLTSHPIESLIWGGLLLVTLSIVGTISAGRSR